MSDFQTPSMHLKTRWDIARRLWDERVPASFIASLYNVSVKAMQTRIHRYRKQFGWFPVHEWDCPLPCYSDVRIMAWESEDEAFEPEPKGYASLAVPLFTAMVWETLPQQGPPEMVRVGTLRGAVFMLEGVTFAQRAGPFRSGNRCEDTVCCVPVRYKSFSVEQRGIGPLDVLDVIDAT